MNAMHMTSMELFEIWWKKRPLFSFDEAELESGSWKQCLIPNLSNLNISFQPPMEFYIRLLFSDLKPSGFFDLPNIAGGNNFHQINRRNLLILPGGPPGLEGNGKPLSDTRFLSLLFLFILPMSLDPPLKWDFLASLFSARFNSVLLMFISCW